MAHLAPTNVKKLRCCHISCPPDVLRRQERRVVTAAALGCWKPDKCFGLMQHSIGRRRLSRPVSLQRRGFCRDHDPGIHVLNERNWKKHGTRVSTCCRSPKSLWHWCGLTYDKQGLRTDYQTLLYLYSTRLHPSPPAARHRSGYLLWTEDLCRLPRERTPCTSR